MKLLLSTAITLFSVFILILISGTDAQCKVQLTYPVLQPSQYNGSWFVIARKAPLSRSFLPSDLNSSLIRLDVDGDERLNMTEYHSVALTSPFTVLRAAGEEESSL
ncbi:hypothetical protein ANCCEY_04312 [Ancylostoma ceylanicum]|uniref:Lipocalin/cytosolic fatty-acid binding domain-containing protein n=1 Tax=Ancylostoma ceylanicum TaxID=53326 RepID=A0A0D6LZG7_9BILA|nr:hypothetical protein ANCCEY_04312 [Ancylostoma ceylanicum]